jgi:hypothetical protein
MHAARPDWITQKTLDILAGIEIGVIGGVLLVVWLAISAPLVGQPWWSILNLFASHSYGVRIVREGPGMVTLSGIAIQILTAGIVGAITGLITPGGRLFGLAISFIWYALCYGFLWKRYAPMVLYAPQPLLVIGFFLYGSALGWHSQIASQLYWKDENSVQAH